MFGWKLYFGELDDPVACQEGADTGEQHPTTSRGVHDNAMEYGWRKYFNELPGAQRPGPAEEPGQQASWQADKQVEKGDKPSWPDDTDQGLAPATGNVEGSSSIARGKDACDSWPSSGGSQAFCDKGLERRPSDMQELVELSRAESPSRSRRTHAFARLKAVYLEEGLLEEEASTLARLALEAHCPIDILTADQVFRVFRMLDAVCLLRCAAVSREWYLQARDSSVWEHCCRSRGWGVEGSAFLGTYDDDNDVAGRWLAASQGARRDAVAESSFSRYWRLCKTRCYVWGVGEHGQLGVLDQAGREIRGSASGLEVMCLRGAAVVRVACGAAHSVCVLASGDVLSWGCGKYGRLGHGTQDNEAQPRIIEALRGKHCSRVACGGAHNLALVHERRGDNGTGAALYVWGSDIFGECGLETPATNLQAADACAGAAADQQYLEPLKPHANGGELQGLPPTREPRPGRQRGGLKFNLAPERNDGVAAQSVADMQCGSAHSLILCLSGLVLAFGRGEYGQQGNGRLEHVRSPAAVPLFDWSRPQPDPSAREETPAQRLQRLRSAAATKSSWHPAARSPGRSSVSLACGGRERADCDDGRAGEEEEGKGRQLDRPIARAIAAGGEHCFAIDMQGGLWAWGWVHRCPRSPTK